MRAYYLALVVGCLAACADEPTIDGIFTKAEWAKIQTLSPLPEPPADPTNAYADNPAAAMLGQQLFFEPSMSGPIVVGNDGTNGGLGAVNDTGKVSCASCHAPATWFSDRRSMPNAVTLGVNWGSRNTTSLVNVAFHSTWTHWDGGLDTQYGPVLAPTENPNEMASSRLAVAHMLWNKYKDEYNAIFTPALPAALDPAAPDAARFPPAGKPGDPAWEMMAPADQQIVDRIFVNYGKAVAAYMRQLRSVDAPFDKYVAGDKTAISTSAKRGLELFIGKAACTGCHDGPAFTDNKFHNTGLNQAGGANHIPTADDGRFDGVAQVLAFEFNSSSMYSDDTTTGRLSGLAQDATQRSAFLTPILRNCDQTGPYMHAGELATLDDVVEFYNRGGDPSGFTGTLDPKMRKLGLTAQEKADLVEFVKTLTGGEVDPALTADTHVP